MPWQVQLKRKDGTIHVELNKGGAGTPPNVGDVINYPINNVVIKARVTKVDGGQPIHVVHADEI